MHEMSLVRALLRQVARVRAVEEGGNVRAIRVQVGPLAGVEPLLLERAFEMSAPGTCADGATLTIEQVPLAARCAACQNEFDIPDFRFRCPACGSGDVQTVQGDAMQLVSVTLEEPIVGK